MTNTTTLSQPFLEFNSPDAVFDAVGGKAFNLAKLAAAGFPVPDGFFIPTTVYQTFVDVNGLGVHIEHDLGGIDNASLEDLVSGQVDRATTVLQTGQLIRMDGSSGKIILLAEENPADDASAQEDAG